MPHYSEEVAFSIDVNLYTEVSLKKQNGPKAGNILEVGSHIKNTWSNLHL